MRTLKPILILWPSFLTAALGSAIAFALVDPLHLPTPGDYAHGRLEIYTVVFFTLWALAALSSAMTIWLSPRRKALDRLDERDD